MTSWKRGLSVLVSLHVVPHVVFLFALFVVYGLGDPHLNPNPHPNSYPNSDPNPNPNPYNPNPKRNRSMAGFGNPSPIKIGPYEKYTGEAAFYAKFWTPPPLTVRCHLWCVPTKTCDSCSSLTDWLLLLCYDGGHYNKDWKYRETSLRRSASFKIETRHDKTRHQP